MAQYDVLLTQNVAAAGVEYTERFVNLAKGSLLSADGSNVPTVLAGGTDGYFLRRNVATATGLEWVAASTFGVSVANQANDRIVTATATTDDLNAEANLTYNNTQGLQIASGTGIVFASAAATYKVYTAAGAVKANLTIETGNNSAGGAGDITLVAGAGTAAGGNVYFQRDTTHGNFYFGTGIAGHLPAKSSETNAVFYDTSTGQLSYGVVSTVTFGASTQIPYTNTTADGFLYSANLAYNGTRLIVQGASSQIQIVDTDDSQAWYLNANVGNFSIVDVGGVGALQINTNNTVASMLQLASDVVRVSTTLEVDYIQEYTASNAVRILSDLVVGADTAATATLDVRGGSDTAIYASSSSNNYGLSLYCAGTGSAAYMRGYSATGLDYRDSIIVGTLSPAGGVGMGTGFLFYLDNAASAIESVGRVGVKWTSVTATAEESQMIFGIMTSGAYAEVMTLDNTALNVQGKSIQFSEIAAPAAPAANTGVLYMDSSNERIYFQNSTTTYDLTGATSGGGWTVSANLITPITAGDDVRLSHGEWLYFGDSGTSYIASIAAGESPGIGIYDGGIQQITTSGTYISSIHHRPLSTTTYDIGSSSVYWRYIYVDSVIMNSTTEYITAGTGYIDVYVGNSQVFRFVSLTGTHTTYNDILAGGTGLDIGDAALPFQSMAADRYYIAGSAAYIETTGSGATLDITFTSTLAGTIALNNIGTGSSNVSVANQADNRIITATGTTDALNAEANLTWNNSSLTVVSSAVPFIFNQSGAIAGNIYYARLVVDGATLRYDICVDDDGVFTPYQTPIAMVKNAAVTLYYNTTARLATSTSGVTVTGTMAATAITVTSTTVVSNLNADRVDSLHATSFLRSDASDSATGALSFSGNNNHTAGYYRFYDNVELYWGSNSDVYSYFTGTHMYFVSASANYDFSFRLTSGAIFTFNMGDGKGTATDWIATSDVRVKDNIRPFHLDMDKFMILGSKAIRHNWKEGWGPTDSPEIGFIAQDVEAFFPELVTITREKPFLRGISYGKMVTVAIKATAQTWAYAKEIDDRVTVIYDEVQQLKDEVQQLKDELNTFKNG